jgi:hypothetical protein
MGALSVAKLCVELEKVNLSNSTETDELGLTMETAFASTVEIFPSERARKIAPVAACG